MKNHLDKILINRLVSYKSVESERSEFKKKVERVGFLKSDKEKKKKQRR